MVQRPVRGRAVAQPDEAARHRLREDREIVPRGRGREGRAHLGQRPARGRQRPLGGVRIDPSRGGYIVNVTREQLEGAPTYRQGEEPDWNDPVYGDRLRGYYGYPLI